MILTLIGRARKHEVIDRDVIKTVLKSCRDFSLIDPRIVKSGDCFTWHGRLPKIAGLQVFNDKYLEDTIEYYRQQSGFLVT